MSRCEPLNPNAGAFRNKKEEDFNEDPEEAAFVGSVAVADTDTEISQGSAENTAQTTVVLDLGVQPTSYTIVIPSTVTLDSAGKGSATITLKSGFVLTDISSLKVRATDGYSEGYTGTYDRDYHASMTLTNSEKNATLDCIIRPNSSNSSEYLTKNTNLISVTNKTDNASDRSSTLNFSVSGSLPSYGRYTGTLTFSVITA